MRSPWLLTQSIFHILAALHIIWLWGWRPFIAKEQRLQPSLDFTEHAVGRMALRGLQESDVYYVMVYGRWFFAAGAIHVFLGKRQIPNGHRSNDQFKRLEGTTILLSSDDRTTVITVYRNRESTRRDRRKAKYNVQKQISQYPMAV
jgi:hypothetical protein